MLTLQTFQPGEWRPPIQKTEATSGRGVAELLETIQKFRAHSADTRASRQRVRQEFRLRDLLSHRFMLLVEETLSAGELQRIVDGITAREVDPYSAAADIMRRVAARVVTPAGEASGLVAPSRVRTES
jgi:LAO/AO transport system kinase